MKYILDTHLFIWWSENNPRLNKETKALISDPKNDIYVSIASAWEMGIKLSLKKLRLKTPLSKLFSQSRIDILPIKMEHITSLQGLPLIHKDPFDRMLIAQAKSEKLTLLTNDPQVKQYQSK